MRQILFPYLIIFFLFCNNAMAQQKQPAILFSIKQGIVGPSQVVAVPFVCYMDGEYQKIPVCEAKARDEKAIDECFQAIRLLVPIITIQQELYILNNGIQTGTTNIINITQYGFSDWFTFSGILEENPKISILTNNSEIGVTELKKLISRPKFAQRKSPEGDILQDKLLTKVDIDGDGIPELIYECNDPKFRRHFRY